MIENLKFRPLIYTTVLSLFFNILILLFSGFSPGCCQDTLSLLLNEASREENLDAAMEKYREIIARYPDSTCAIEAQIAVAELEYLSGNSELAHSEYESFVSKFPRHKQSSLAWYRMGVCSMEMGEYDRAIDEFRRSISANPWAEHIILSKIGIADAYLARCDYSRALREYRWIFPGYLEPYVLYKICICYKKLGNERYFSSVLDQLKKKYPLSREAKIAATYEKTKRAEEQVTIETASVSSSDSKPFPADEKELVKASAKQCWTIQVGSFIKEANAYNLAILLKKKGYSPRIQKVNIGNGIFYRVYVGSYDTEARAKEKAKKILAEEGLPAHIVKE